MPANPPVDFQQLAQGPTGQTNADYPYAIKATDLMKNFVFATLDIAEGVYEETTGMQGHRQRRLKIDAGTAANQLYIWDGNKITAINATPTEGSVLAFTGGAFNYIPAPSSGTYVLGSTGGALSWIETEACD